MTKLLCTVWSSPKKEEMYLYTERLKGLERVPEELLELFGKPKEVMAILLTEEKKLGRADIKDVMKKVQIEGYYLQMPPHRDDYMLDLYKDTSAKYTDIL